MTRYFLCLILLTTAFQHMQSSVTVLCFWEQRRGGAAGIQDTFKREAGFGFC